MFTRATRQFSFSSTLIQSTAPSSFSVRVHLITSMFIYVILVVFSLQLFLFIQFFSPVRVLCPVHLILESIILIFDEEHILRSLSLCNFPKPSIISSLKSEYYLQRLFSNISFLCSSLSMIDQNKITGNIEGDRTEQHKTIFKFLHPFFGNLAASQFLNCIHSRKTSWTWISPS